LKKRYVNQSPNLNNNNDKEKEKDKDKLMLEDEDNLSNMDQKFKTDDK